MPMKYDSERCDLGHWHRTNTVAVCDVHRCSREQKEPMFTVAVMHRHSDTEFMYACSVAHLGEVLVHPALAPASVEVEITVRQGSEAVLGAVLVAATAPRS